MDKEFSPKPKDIGEQVAASMPKQFQEAFARVVKAGMKVIFSDETHDDVIELLNKNEGDLGVGLGQQMAGLMGILVQKSNGTMPSEVIIPAGVYLLSKAAEFIEKVTGEEMAPDMVAIAMQTMIDSLLQGAGVDPNQFLSVSEQALAKAKEGQAA